MMRQILAIVTLLLSYGTPVRAAAVLVTPLADANGSSQTVECTATNYSAKPAAIVVGLFDVGGMRIASTFDNCNGVALPPGHTCAVTVAQAAACRVVTPTTKVHVAIEVWDCDTGRLQVMSQASKE
jgi:hypothetical protein